MNMFRYLLLNFLLLILGFIFLSFPVKGQVSEPLISLIEEGPAADSFWAVAVTDSSGRLIFDYNANKLIRPASTQKLITSAAFLHYLGPDFRFETTLYGIGEQEGDIWNGDILIRGKGDPSISGDFYDDPMFLFEVWTQLFDSLGIRQIRGNIIGNESYFDDVPFPRGWEWDDLSYYYAVETNALSFNNNVVNLEVLADGAIGTTPEIQWFPFNTPFVEFINEQIITPSNTSFNESYRRILGTNTIVLRSSLPRGYYETEPLSVTYPSLYFIDTFRRYLQQMGIRVTGQLITDRQHRNWSDQDYQILHVHQSRPLRELIQEKNQNSNNFYTEMMLKTVAAERFATEGSTDLGIQAVKQYLNSTGIDTNYVRMRDGSGMAPANLLRASDLNRLLFEMKSSNHFEHYHNSLALAGRSGTLRYRFHNSPVVDRFYGKTGFMSGVRTISGYLKTRDDQELIVTIATNNFTRRTAVIDGVHQRILEYLYSIY
jgi:serine-type D-Ala-D-Ala carboxypeptidase/endopeptidase (penicillin-binding protein 4)